MEMDFLRRWVAIVSIGEAVGFAVPAIVGVLFFEESGVVFLVALVAAGLLEGALLGGAQWLALRSELPRLGLGRWAGGTAVGAVVAYAVGMLPSTLYETWVTWPVVAQVVFFVVTGSAMLASIGTAQWVELRRHVSRAGRWIIGTAAAWATALAVFGLISTPLWQEGQSVGLRIAIGMFAGLVMAVVMAFITGRIMQGLLGKGSGEGNSDVRDQRSGATEVLR